MNAFENHMKRIESALRIQNTGSEVKKNMQKVYVEEIYVMRGIKKVKRGYMNFGDFEQLYGKSCLDELQKEGRSGDAIGQGAYMFAEVIEY